jgi:hypothetical protein
MPAAASGTESDILEAMKVLQSGKCLKIHSRERSATEDDSGDGQVMEESQGSLFTGSRTGTR